METKQISNELENREKLIKEKIIPPIQVALQEVNEEELVPLYLEPLFNYLSTSKIFPERDSQVEALIQKLFLQKGFHLNTDKIFSTHKFQTKVLKLPRKLLLFEDYQEYPLSKKLIKIINNIANFHYYITDYSENTSNLELATMLKKSLMKYFHGPNATAELLEDLMKVKSSSAAYFEHLNHRLPQVKLTAVKNYYQSKLSSIDNLGTFREQQIQNYIYLIEYFGMLQKKALSKRSFSDAELQYFFKTLSLFEQESRNVTSNQELGAKIFEYAPFIIAVILCTTLSIIIDSFCFQTLLTSIFLLLPPTTAPAILLGIGFLAFTAFAFVISNAVLIGGPYTAKIVGREFGRYCFFSPVPEAIKELNDEMKNSLCNIPEQAACTSSPSLFENAG